MADYTLSDYRAATEGNGSNNWGNAFGAGVGGFIGSAIGNGGFGFGGNGGRGQYATTEEVAAGFNFAGINNKLNEITAGQANINQNLSNAICQAGYQNLELSAGLGSKIDNCCCATQRAADSVKFDMANYAAASNANTIAVGQKVLDKLCQMESNQKDFMLAQQGQRITQLETQRYIDNATCGIPKTSPYGYGLYAYPACGGNACCNAAY